MGKYSMTNFINWLKKEGFESSANFGMGNNTPGSYEVKRTGLQPQVDAQDIKTNSRLEQDMIMGIDSHLERVNEILADVDDRLPKISQFKKSWNQLMHQWQKMKIGDHNTPESGLGNVDPRFSNDRSVYL